MGIIRATWLHVSNWHSEASWIHYVRVHHVWLGSELNAQQNVSGFFSFVRKAHILVSRRTVRERSEVENAVSDEIIASESVFVPDFNLELHVIGIVFECEDIGPRGIAASAATSGAFSALTTNRDVNVRVHFGNNRKELGIMGEVSLYQLDNDWHLVFLLIL